MESSSKMLGGALFLLRAALGFGALLAGVDKFLDRLTTWSMYLSPQVERLPPLSGAAFLRAGGVLEMAIGVAILTRFTRIAAFALARLAEVRAAVPARTLSRLSGDAART